MSGCKHFMFSFGTVNFEYMHLDKDFESRALNLIRKKGYEVASLPCPVEPWAEDDDGNEMPSLQKLMPGLEMIGYCYSAPHGHGSWGIVAGFENHKPIRKASKKVT